MNRTTTPQKLINTIKTTERLLQSICSEEIEKFIKTLKNKNNLSIKTGEYKIISCNGIPVMRTCVEIQYQIETGEFKLYQKVISVKFIDSHINKLIP